MRNEYASEHYTTDFLTRVFEEEGAGLFDVRQSVIGHQQQGGNPSPFDRLLAVRLVNKAISALDGYLSEGKDDCTYVGMTEGEIKVHRLSAHGRALGSGNAPAA